MIFYHWLFISAIIFFIAALVLQYRYQHTRVALALLFGAAFLVRLFFAHTDPFLHEWDEKFHALVAKNMMAHPFTPMLRLDPIYVTDPNVWCCNHVWLHKQPLFMWQMALSMKIFGVSEFSIRYPSVLMGALMVLLIYRIARTTLGNKGLGFFAATLLCFAYFHLGMIGGFKAMDHNDVTFSFYVLASIWAYIEYTKKYSMKWAVLIGLLAGCAILTKWLTGLLVYSAWGIQFLLSLKQGAWRVQLKHLLLSLLVCAIVFVPWQLYILNAFPELASYEYAYNSKHIFEAVEGHSGSNAFYWDRFIEYYGPFIYLLVPVGMILLLLKRDKDNKATLAIVTTFLVTYIFFSYVVKTKMEGYVYIVIPLGYIFIAAIAAYIRSAKWQRLILPVASIVLCFVGLRHNKVIQDHSDTPYRQAKIHNTGIYKNLSNIIPKNIDLVFNVNEFEDVDVMFYNDGINASFYWYWPDKMEEFKNAGKKIASFKSRENYVLSDYVFEYPYLCFIDADLK